MSDSTNQRRTAELQLPELNIFTLVKNDASAAQIVQNTLVPGLSEEQLKELPEAAQAAIKTESLADWNRMLEALTPAEKENLDKVFLEADCMVLTGYAMPQFPSAAEAEAVRAVVAQQEARLTDMEQALHGKREDLVRRQAQTAAAAGEGGLGTADEELRQLEQDILTQEASLGKEREYVALATRELDLSCADARRREEAGSRS